MVKKTNTQKKKEEANFIFSLFKWSFKLFRFILTIPFYLIKLIFVSTKKIEEKIETKNVEEKRESMKAKYTRFKTLEKVNGNYDELEKHLFESDSTIGIILGARGKGKSALALKIFENLYARKKPKLYAMGFSKNEMPSWVEVVESVEKIKNDSYVLIDEGGILFSSRKSMSGPNKLLSDLMLVARHKNLSILFISQNSSNLEVNILRQADYLMLKPSSLLQKNFERRIIKEIYTKTSEGFSKFSEDKGLTYIHSDKFGGFISNPLPSFWNVKISKSWGKK